MVIPNVFESVIRKTIRDLFLETQRIPTLDTILTRMRTYKVSDIQYCNIDGLKILDENTPVWIWSRATLHRYMQKIGFVYKERISYYENKKTSQDNIALRDNYLEWMQKYRSQDYDIFYQDETWVFKNMTRKKIWKDTKGDSTKNIFNVPHGTGERSKIQFSQLLLRVSGRLYWFWTGQLITPSSMI